MFDCCNNLKDINELKYLNVNEAKDFNHMFYGCSSLSNIDSLKNWNVSNGKNFYRMFAGCSSLSDITTLKIGMFQMVMIFMLCSLDAHLYQILSL